MKSGPVLAVLWITATAVAVGAAPAAGPAGKPAIRRRTDVVIPLRAGVPAELVPFKTGTMTKVAPATLQAVLKVGPLPPVTAVCFTGDGKSLLVGSYGEVSVWDLEQGRISGKLGGVEGAVHDIAISPDGKILAVAGGKPSQTGTVLLFDAAAPFQPKGRLEGHADVAYSLAWSPDSKRIATGSFDKTVKVWDVAGKSEVFTVRDHSDFVYAVAFSPDGKILASGGRDKAVKLFDASNGKSIRTLSGHGGEVLAVAVSSDGKSVLSTGMEPAIRWWDAATGKTKNTQRGHGREVFEIRRSADGKQFLTVSQDHTARLWDGASGAPVKAFNSEGEPLLSAALSPDGKRLAAGGAEGRVRLWDVASGRLLVLALVVPGSATPELLLATPEGYVAGSPGTLAQLQWRVGGEPVAQEPFTRGLIKPEEVFRALRGEAVTAVKLEAPKTNQN
jgi:WD40 repeat protein